MGVVIICQACRFWLVVDPLFIVGWLREDGRGLVDCIGSQEWESNWLAGRPPSLAGARHQRMGGGWAEGERRVSGGQAGKLSRAGASPARFCVWPDALKMPLRRCMLGVHPSSKPQRAERSEEQTS